MIFPTVYNSIVQQKHFRYSAQKLISVYYYQIEHHTDF
ncbi:hypothetical protein SMSK23_1414 [Streptococcus oralis ATCC 35037]|nr:hypothetical protein SMSK23_1414 [Streptococcus oralis ATCC 35037]